MDTHSLASSRRARLFAIVVLARSHAIYRTYDSRSFYDRRAWAVVLSPVLQGDTMTEAQLWRKIAEDACARMARGEDGFRKGLCWEIHTLCWDYIREGAVCNAMLQRIAPHVNYSYAYAYHDEQGHNTRCDEGRLLAALWFACEAEAEATP